MLWLNYKTEDVIVVEYNRYMYWYQKKIWITILSYTT